MSTNKKRIWINKIEDESFDLKKLFLEYSQDEYIPLLERSNANEIQERLAKIDDEDEAIQTFVSNNIDRVYLLLSRHFDEDFVESERFKYFNADAWKVELDYDFREEAATVQNQYLYKHYRKYILDFCFDNDLLLCDGLYISPNAKNTYATKCYGYKLHPRLYELNWRCCDNKYRLEINESLYNQFTNPKKTYRQQNYSPTSERIIEMTKAFKLDVDSIPEKYGDDVDEFLNMKKNEVGLEDNYGKRVCTPESMMEGDLREYLYIDSKDERYANADISNCTHYIFANMMLDSLDLSNYKLDQIDKLGKEIRSNTFEQNEIKHLLTKLIQPVYSKNKTDIRDVLGELFNYAIMDKANKKTLIKLFSTSNRKNRERLAYSLLSISGMFYEVLMDKFGYTGDRSKFKKSLSSLLNCEIDKMYMTNGVYDEFRKYFPRIFKKIKNEKRYYYKNLGYKITRQETSLMIEIIAKQLLDENKQFIFLYDGIIIDKNEVEDVADRIRTQSKKVFNLTAPVSIEKYYKTSNIFDEIEENLRTV